MSGKLQIREGRESDKEASIEATLAAYAEYERFMPSEVFEEYMASVVRTIAGEDGPVERIVAEHDGVIVGSVLIIPAGTVVTDPAGKEFTFALTEVRLLAVAPSARGKGIGRALMEECIRRTREAGLPALSLHSIDFMQDAIRLYGRMGFVHLTASDSEAAPGVVVRAFRMDF